MESFAEAFPGLYKNTEEVIEEDTIEVINLWYSSESIFRIYKIVRNYLNENYGIDSMILIELIKANKLDMEDMLFKIPYLHSGYISVLLEDRKLENVREDSIN